MRARVFFARVFPAFLQPVIGVFGTRGKLVNLPVCADALSFMKLLLHHLHRGRDREDAGAPSDLGARWAEASGAAHEAAAARGWQEESFYTY
jgi:hypothetical protein